MHLRRKRKMNLTDDVPEIGDTVKIVDYGETYTTHQSAALTMKLKNWVSGHCVSTKNRYINEYTVVGEYFKESIRMKQFCSERILGISNGVEDFVIGVRGVKIIKKGKVKIEKPIEPQRFDENNLYNFND